MNTNMNRNLIMPNYDEDDIVPAATPNRSGPPRISDPGETTLTRGQYMALRDHPERPPVQARLAENPEE